ncbi:MAG: 1,4-dihydroxy-2-naphthoate octaprenyltransferase [Candidatus Amulumruptor caecigallinarius]|nr:1,4-dihydroxy-2-naphthoate octaprenyltransferase [Candidatus Amulumruptor caecigallinarius]
MNKRIKVWIEAMRLRTLPVSVAGVVTGGGCAAYYDSFKPLPFLICLLFAVCAQITSNFANEYFDYKNGLDRKGREGFRRGVTEGDISPANMRNATFGLLAFTCLTGCSLIYWGGLLIIPVGIAIAIFALAYSAGPYPLSHHGLGEIAVLIFFGIVPVCLTTYLQTGSFDIWPVALPLSVAIGTMGSNVLIINNYRDRKDDLAVGKRTLAVRFGSKSMRHLYLVNGFVSLLFIEIATAIRIPMYWQLGALIYINVHYMLWQKMGASQGKELNPILGQTSMLMFGVSLWLAAALIMK